MNMGALGHPRKIKLDRFRGTGKKAFDYVIRRFNASSAGLKKAGGDGIDAETPFSAISRSNWSPESTEVEAALQSAS
jgi:hypothetical protein